ncbi:13995_t:CDS:10 [Acaulospora colombiana]|uniref:13995_t:CDS:1 n=1 Tax=Acaulospora colombiana TaxID=27376 RepID=A0ACA9KMV6_9GLOM|nr:13995_t:CDS:10 [Acaulospora colombiana]
MSTQDTQDFIPIIQDESTADDNIASPTRGKTNLFVRKIPHDATDLEFETFFSVIGPIRSCFLVKGARDSNSSITPSDPEESNSTPRNGEKLEKDMKNRGYGFVKYVISQDAERALQELKTVKFRGTHTLEIEFALKKHEKPSIVETNKKKMGHSNAEKKRKLGNKYSNKVENTSRTILIQGLPKDLTRKKLYKKVRKFGDVEDIIFPCEGHEIAHIIFKTTKDSVNALNHLDEHVFHGSKMSAKLLNTEVKDKSNSFDKKSRIIIRNVPWEYREQDLLKIFSAHGEVVEVNLPRKYKGGPLRGFAYVQYKNIEDAEKAINELNETEHHGRIIAVDWSLSKDKYLEAVRAFQAKLIGDQGSEPDALKEEYIDEEEVGSENGQDFGKEETRSENDDNVEEDGVSEDDGSDDDENVGEVTEDDGSDGDEVTEEDDEVTTQSESDDNSEDEEVVGTGKRNIHPPSEGTVLFIRNLAFEATEEELGAMLISSVWTIAEHADACLSEAKKVHHLAADSTELSSKRENRKELMYKSILTADPSDSQALKFTLHGRVLSVNLLAKNPNLYISKTRLSIRNMPLTVDESKLKSLGKESVKNFKEEVRKGERDDLTKSEKMWGWDKLVCIKQAKIVRSKDKIDSSIQKLRSKGYGFLEYTEHAHALAALRFLNNNPKIFGEKRRLIVEFAIENTIIVKKRMERIRGGVSGKSNGRDVGNKSIGDSKKPRVTLLNNNGGLKRKGEIINDAHSMKKKKVKAFHRKSPSVNKRNQ